LSCRDVYYPGYGSKPAHENQDNKDDYDDADDTDATVTKAVTVAAEAATKPPSRKMMRIMMEHESAT
jgi:hypothetical protein